MSEQIPCPVLDDTGATIPQLHAAAANDYATQQAALRAKQAQGESGERQGVLHGEGH